MSHRSNPFESLKITRQHIHEQIAEYIEGMVAANELKEGQQLPSERELAAMLQVNRNSVRQAMYLLQQRGLVEIRLGSGSYITRMPNTIVGQTIARYFIFGSCSHNDLMSLREILEPGVAAMAARLATAEDLQRLETLVEELEAAYERRDLDANVEADAAFHEALAAATHNDLIIAIMGGLQSVMRKWLKAQAEAGPQEEGTRGHRIIYQAVAARDPERAAEAMRVHMAYARSVLQR